MPPFSALPAYLLRTYQFAGGAGQTRVEARLGLIKDILQFVRASDEYRGSYEVNLAVFDARGECVASRTWQRHLATSTFAATNDRTSHLQEAAVFQLPPGKYQLRAEIVDRHTQKRLRRQYPLAVRDFHTGGLQVSSLALGEGLKDSAGTAVLGAYNLSALLQIGRPQQYLFYEIYGVAAGDSLTIDYALINARGDTLESWSAATLAAANVAAMAENLTDRVRRSGSQSLRVRVHNGAQAVTAGIDFKAQAAAAPQTAREAALPEILRQAPLQYISSRREYQKMTAAPPGARDSLVAAFWRQRDPTPGTARNELRDEFYRRVAQAEAEFAAESLNQPGWQTDRGRIYIIHGAPREVHVRAREEEALLYEIWFYPEIGRRFIFRERGNSGLFELINR